ncbi:MAG: hypothetical protein QNJ13_10835 [Paracoccaceae bacterium]|nr:hypothetical protein [Paracoccaceae bacterium]
MPACLLDTHVHLYDAFSPAAFLDAAAGTVAAQARRAGLAETTPGVLMLVQTPAERPPAVFFDPPPPGWQVAAADAHGSLRLTSAGRPALYLVPGRQIVAEEGLEVLGLGLGAVPADGRPAADTLAEVQAAGGLPVLPYGVGKWQGRRGDLVLALCADPDAPTDLVLGDISGRLGFLGRPAHFARLEAAGRIVLPGSDPLPFPGEVAKVARLVCAADFAPDAPRDSVLAWLRGLDRTPPALGRYETLARFLPLQVGMQIAKRRRRAQTSPRRAA